MEHWRAVKGLRENYTRRGVWIWLRHYGLAKFLRQPSDVRARAAQLSDGAFV